MQNKIRKLLPHYKQTIAMAFDTGAAWGTLWLAFLLHYETWFWPSGTQLFLFIVSPLLAIPVFVHFGLYRAVILFTGLYALITILKAVGIYGLVFTATILSMPSIGLPRSIGLLQALLFLMSISISRALVRFWLSAEKAYPYIQAEHLLIYGAGSAGIQIAHALYHAKRYRVLGFMDDDANLQGKTINGWPVYKPAQLAYLVEHKGAQGVLLALPSIQRTRRNQIVQLLRTHGLHVRSLPSLVDLASGNIQVSDIRELDADDLLERTPIAPDMRLLRQNITHKTVLVTGAGGSIGGELCRHILSLNPSHLLLLDHSEFALYTIHQDLQTRMDAANHTQLIPLLANVRDPIRLNSIFESWQPYAVYHAAAYKHVPMVEHNVAEGVATNVLGTYNTAQAAASAGTAYFVLISTDKAVRPTNVMGASKRMAELVLQAMAMQATKTIFTMVRFGNVLDSSGSVVPLFRRQIKEGGPLTLTHPDVTRFFMTIPEAAQLVIQAGAMAQGGEVFVLDMGEPIKIGLLAKRMIELSGLTIQDENNPKGDIEIQITGLRPGEKLYEELLIGNQPKPSQHPKIMMASEAFVSWQSINDAIQKISQHIGDNQVVAIRTLMTQLVDGYIDHNPVVDWVTIQNQGFKTQEAEVSLPV